VCGNAAAAGRVGHHNHTIHDRQTPPCVVGSCNCDCGVGHAYGLGNGNGNGNAYAYGRCNDRAQADGHANCSDKCGDGSHEAEGQHADDERQQAAH
jgi:hypothetical protein